MSRLAALLFLSLAACGVELSCGVDIKSHPAQPCAYRDSDPVYCACFRTCPTEPQCVLHVGRCTGEEPGECPIATVEVRTSTAVESIALGEACGVEP